MATVNEFLGWPILLVLGLVGLIALLSFAGARRTQVKLPFMCGENVQDSGRSFLFRGPMDEPTTAQAASWYFTEWFGEKPMTRWANLVAILILLSLAARILFVWYPG